MLECINKKCSRNNNEKCLDKIDACNMRIKPTHTPSYAEEQLNHAIDKEYECYSKKCDRCIENECTATNVYKVCANRESKPINYEEEYHKIKKENEELKKELKDIKHIYYNSDISEVKEENRQLKDRNKLLEEKDKEQEERIKIQKSTIIELKEDSENYTKEIKEHIEYIGKIQVENKELKKEIDSLKLKAAVTEKLEIEINNLNEIIEGKDKELEIWINVSKEADNEIAELKRLNENQRINIKDEMEENKKQKETIEDLST